MQSSSISFLLIHIVCFVLLRNILHPLIQTTSIMICSVWHHTHFVMRQEPDHFFTTNVFTSGFIRLQATSVQLKEDHHDVLLCHHAHDVMRKEPDESFTANLFTSNLCGYYHGFKFMCIISCVRGHAYEVMRRVPDCVFSFVFRTHFVMREERDDSSDVSAYKPHWFQWKTEIITSCYVMMRMM
jgi:hypothetical protein